MEKCCKSRQVEKRSKVKIGAENVRGQERWRNVTGHMLEQVEKRLHVKMVEKGSQINMVE